MSKAVKKKRRFERLKVLKNPHQGQYERAGYCLDNIHGPGIQKRKALFNRVGFYYQTNCMFSECWLEYKDKDGSYFAVVPYKSIGETFKVTLSGLLDSADGIPTKEVAELLNQIKKTGFKLGKDLGRKLAIYSMQEDSRKRRLEVKLRFVRFCKSKGISTRKGLKPLLP